MSTGRAAAAPQGTTPGRGAAAPQGTTPGRGAAAPQGTTPGRDPAAPQGTTSGRAASAPQGTTSGRAAAEPQGTTSGRGAAAPQGATPGRDPAAPQGATSGRAACLIACCALAAGCGASTGSGARPTSGSAAADPELLLHDTFSTVNGSNGLITNEYALSNSDGVRSPLWEMTSGSLFSRGGAGWSGEPDTSVPDRLSRRATGSATFRLRTKRASFRDVAITADIRVNRWSKARRGQLGAIVLWVRYAAERKLYWPSVLRADGKVDISKKVPGGPFPDNGGTYYILPPYTVRGWPVTLGRWYRIRVTARNGADGSVTISTYRDGRRMMTSVDEGAGQRVQFARTGARAGNPGAALTRAGRLGIRADNADFDVRSYTVRALPPAAG